jgi:hypothetical protein
MAELLVFVSSIMERKKDDLFAERDAAKEAIQGLGLTQPWRFEDSPASSLRVDYSYLNKIGESDLFLLILGREITGPVKMEYDAAIAAGKPLLIFLKKGDRTPEAQAFVDAVKVKWKSFADAAALKLEVRTAIAEELIQAHRRKAVPLAPADVATLEKVAPPGAAASGASSIATNQQSGGANIGAGATIQGHVAGRDVKITEIRRAGRDYYEARDHGTINITSQSSPADMVKLLEALKGSLGELNLPPREQRRAEHAIEGARLEAEAADADKDTVADRLKEAATVVKNAGTLAVEATKFGALLAKGLAWAGKTVAWLAL